MKSRLKVVLLVAAIVLVVALLYIALSNVGKMSKTMLSSNQVNCKTLRLTAAEAIKKFKPLEPISLSATCVAGLDSPDKITYMLAADSVDFARDPADGLVDLGWQRKAASDVAGTQLFTKPMQTEGKNVTYVVRIVQVSTSPDVRQITFTSELSAFSSFSAFADYAKADEVPSDIKMTEANRQKYAVPKIQSFNFAPEGYTVSQPKRVAFDEVQFSFTSTTMQGNNKKPTVLTLIIKLNNSLAPDNCGGATIKNQSTCEQLGVTTNGVEVYAPVPGENTNRRFYDTYATYGNYQIRFLNSYRAPYVQPQLTDEQIIETFEAITAAIQ